MSLFADSMALYVENPTESIRKLLELINEFGNVADKSKYIKNKNKWKDILCS